MFDGADGERGRSKTNNVSIIYKTFRTKEENDLSCERIYISVSPTAFYRIAFRSLSARRVY